MNRIKIGSILKSKTKGQTDYIKIDKDITLKAGTVLSLDSKESKLAWVHASLASGSMTQENANKIMEFVHKIPDFVRFEITLNTDPIWRKDRN